MSKENLQPIVQNLIETKNTAFLTGNVYQLHRLFYPNDPISQKAFEKEKSMLEAKFRSALDRKIKFNGHTTKIYLGPEVRTNDFIKIKVIELVTWWYLESERLGYERQQFSHDLTLVYNGKWLIKDDYYRQEPKIATIPRPVTKFSHKEQILGTKVFRGNTYDRNVAVQYAHKWWNGHNPNFRYFSVDCTNYVSQILYSGGIPMTFTEKQNSGWWYQGNGEPNDKWSYSWAVAHSLRWYLASGKGAIPVEQAQNPEQLLPGDVICYDWDGDGVWQHNTVVVAHNTYGQPLVNAHTSNCQYRYWDYRDSPAWSENTRYIFWKIG